MSSMLKQAGIESVLRRDINTRRGAVVPPLRR